jgi:transposase
VERIGRMKEALVGVKREFMRLDNINAQPETYIEKQAELLTVLAQGMEEMAQLQERNIKLEQELAKMAQTNAKYRQMIFGSSSDQTARVLGMEEAAQIDVSAATGTGSTEWTEPTIEEATTPPSSTTAPVKRGKKVKGMREASICNLPHVDVAHELTQSERKCEECGGELTYIGKDHVRYDMVYQRAKVIVRRHWRYNYVCKQCQNGDGEREKIEHAQVGSALQKNSLQTPSLDAYILTAKCVNAMPLDRISKSFERDGVYINTEALARWMIYVADGTILKRIYEKLHEEIQKETVVHADATFFQVNKEPERKPSKESCMWQVQTGKYAPSQIVLFNYFLSENITDLLGMLKEYKGYMNCDGKAAYHKLKEEIVPVGCWQHARDYFMDALKILKYAQRGKSPAAVGVRYIDKMFALERQYDKLKLTAEQRYQARQDQTKAISDKFFEWARDVANQPRAIALEPKLGDAVRYALNQRQYLENVYLDGRLELSNNRAERVFAHFAIGRNNWKFCDSQDGAYALAINYSITLTALANGLHPEKYLEFLLENNPHPPEDADIGDYMPWSDKLPMSLKLPQRYEDILEAQKLIQSA